VSCVDGAGDGYDHIGYIDLEEYNLRGSIPESLANLTYLQELEVDTNFLTGTFPHVLLSLQFMQYLDISENEFVGTIPSPGLNWTQMYGFQVGYNAFTGTLPATYFLLPALTEINVGGNQLHGTLPKEIGEAKLLDLFNMYENFFSGTVPEEVGQMTALSSFAVSGNLLTGTLPAVLGSLQFLQYIGINENWITGSIPSSLCNVFALHTINTTSNGMTGALPTCLSHVQRLFLSNNRYIGSLPSTLHTWVNVTQIILSNNALTGTLPPHLEDLQLLRFLYVDNNQLTGTLPAGLGQIRELESLNLSHNALTGTIPSAYSQIVGMQVLLLHSNALTGSISDLFDAAVQTNITAVQLSQNQLTGQLPAAVFQLPKLNVFAAVSNCFDGSLPEEICESTSLLTIAMDGLQSATSCRQSLLPFLGNGAYTVRNSIAQGIPACLFQMPQLRTLHLSGNGLTGSLPDIAISPALTELSLSHNYLRGEIPSAFQQQNWASVDLSYNQLRGSLKSGFVAASNASVTLEQNRLSGDIPYSLQVLEDVSVLGSNLFWCDERRSQLPTHNPDRDKYQCGSQALNATVYAWMGLSFVLTVAVALALWQRRRRQREQRLGEGLAKKRGAGRELLLEPAVWRRWWRAASGDRIAPPVETTPDTDAMDRPAVSAEGTTAQYGPMRAVWLMFQLLCNSAVVSAVLVVLLLLPAYCALSQSHGTLLHQYAWTLSAAFLSGDSAFATMIVLFAVLMCAFLAQFYLQLRGRQQELAADPSAAGAATAAASAVPYQPYALICAVYVLFNFSVVGGVNTAYIYTSLNATDSVLVFVQLVLSVFKLAFNRFAAPMFLRIVAESILSRHSAGQLRYITSDYVTLQLLVTLVNNIVIPCIVVAVISPSCFVNVFKSAPTVDSTFTYNGNCLEEDNDDDGIAIRCLVYNTQQETTTYNPPFQYSYQCSSSIVTYYAPAMVNVCVLATFAAPVGQAVGQYLHSVAAPGGLWHQLLSIPVPRLLQPLPPPEALPPGANIQYFAAHLQLISLCNFLGLLLTFGIVFPPLAITFAVTILATTLHSRLKVGRFLCLAEDAGRRDCVTQISTECMGVGDIRVLRRAALMILQVSCLFYALFLFDTLGDVHGYEGAYWVLIVVPLLPVCLLAGYVSYVHYGSGPQGSAAAGGDGRADGGAGRSGEGQLELRDSSSLSAASSSPGGAGRGVAEGGVVSAMHA
jgi:Leucine-rich repeat (LRR) protein